MDSGMSLCILMAAAFTSPGQTFHRMSGRWRTSCPRSVVRLHVPVQDLDELRHDLVPEASRSGARPWAWARANIRQIEFGGYGPQQAVALYRSLADSSTT